MVESCPFFGDRQSDRKYSWTEGLCDQLYPSIQCTCFIRIVQPCTFDTLPYFTENKNAKVQIVVSDGLIPRSDIRVSPILFSKFGYDICID